MVRQHKTLQTESGRLEADLSAPPKSRGVVLFAHGSGSGRQSPRNQRVARALQEAGVATFLMDLLSDKEKEVDSQTGELRFEIGFLAERLRTGTEWILHEPETEGLQVGYFGASTGSAAALFAATRYPDTIRAIVSRGGRTDLASEALSQVQAPTLFIVGENDEPILSMNQEAMKLLASADKELAVVPNATHLFEEPGALDQVARLTSDWFVRHFS